MEDIHCGTSAPTMPSRRRNWLKCLSTSAIGFLTMRSVRSRRRKNTPFACLTTAKSWAEADERSLTSLDMSVGALNMNISYFPLTLRIPTSLLGFTAKSANNPRDQPQPPCHHGHNHHSHNHHSHHKYQHPQQHSQNPPVTHQHGRLDDGQHCFQEYGATPHATSVQRLVAAGSRMWGTSSWLDARSMLGAKIYDFAVYVDEAAWQQMGPSLVATDKSSSRSGGWSSSTPACATHKQSHMLTRVMQCPGPPCSLVLRAARDLPCQLLHAGMSGTLSRRYIKAGGLPGDPQLQLLLRCFSTHALPRTVRSPCGMSVKRGTVMVFSRSQDGQLTAAALEDGEQLQALGAGQCVGKPMLPSPVWSPQLGEALLDLHLGDQPVDPRARVAAASALHRLAAPASCSQGVVYTPTCRQSVHCRPGSDDLGACMLVLQ